MFCNNNNKKVMLWFIVNVLLFELGFYYNLLRLLVYLYIKEGELLLK